MRKRSGQVHSRESSATLQLTVSLLYLLCFWVYAKKLSCEILNLLQITHKKLNMGL